MKRKIDIFGKVIGLDPCLLEDSKSFSNLIIRRRDDYSVILFSPARRMITITTQSMGRGPDRVLVETIPPVSQPLPSDGWIFRDGAIKIPELGMIDLSDSPRTPSATLSPIRDFPGHMRSALGRATRLIGHELEFRLKDLADSLKATLTEAVELPILKIVGFGPGAFSPGDRALCGIALTGRAFSVGKRLKADWVGRFNMEIRRFIHRTTWLSAANLRFAVEGRTTATQEKFFQAMEKDFEGSVDLAVENIYKGIDGVGMEFLAGVRTALDIIRSDMHPSFTPENRVILSQSSFLANGHD